MEQHIKNLERNEDDLKRQIRELEAELLKYKDGQFFERYRELEAQVERLEADRKDIGERLYWADRKVDRLTEERDRYRKALEKMADMLEGEQDE